MSHSLTIHTPSYSGILRSVVKRNTDELPGDHSEDRNAEKKVQLIMSTATLTKVITHLTPSSYPFDLYCPRHLPLPELIQSFWPLKKLSIWCSCHIYHFNLRHTVSYLTIFTSSSHAPSSITLINISFTRTSRLWDCYWMMCKAASTLNIQVIKNNIFW